MAKQYRIHQLWRNGAAIEGYERCIDPVAGIVDSAGKQLLAGTGFTIDQHWHITLSKDLSLSLGLESSHVRITGDDTVKCSVNRGIQHGQLRELRTAEATSSGNVFRCLFKGVSTCCTPASQEGS